MLEAHVFAKGASLYDKLDEFDALLRRIGKLKPQAYYVEQALKNHHRTRMHVLGLLQRFNGMICALMYTRTGIRPELIDASHARKTLGIKNDKLVAFEWARNELPQATILRETKSTGTLKDYCYDAADAYVIARAAYVKTYNPIAGGAG